MQKTLILLHRAGRHKSYGHKENTLARARVSAKHPQVDGFEIDVRLAKDGVPIVHHDRVRRYTAAEFKRQKQGNTLAEWLGWLKKNPKKTLYLDTKERIPVRTYFRAINGCGGRVWIGSRDPWYVAELVREKRRTGSTAVIFYMTWNSIFAQSQVWLADYYFRKHDARPDGIHAMYEEIAPLGLWRLHLKLIRRLIRAARKKGYLVSGGTGGRGSIRRQLQYGVDCLMPDHHDHLPSQN